MSPIINISDKGIKEYKSNLYKVGESPEEAYKRDDMLDELIKRTLSDLVNNASEKELRRNKVSFYWRVGSALREIFLKSGLVVKEDKDLFFRNVSFRMKEFNCFPKDAPSKRRNIPEQFFRLAGYDEEIALKAIWTAWSYIFDSPIFNRPGIDGVLESILKDCDYEFDQAFSRAWSQVFTYLFKNIDPRNWSNEEFHRVIVSSLEIINVCYESNLDLSNKVVRSNIINALRNNNANFVRLKNGNISVDIYVSEVLNGLSI